MKKIVVLNGGNSPEREVSLASGRAVEDSLKRLSYNVIRIDVDDNIISSLKELSPDLVFNALHGKNGEDGTIAGLLEVMKIPYTHSGIMASAIGMNKFIIKPILKSLAIDSPNWQIATPEELLSNSEIISYPYVIKPIDSGSSIDVNMVFSYSDYCKIKTKYRTYDKILIEEYIPGKELHTAVLFNNAIGTIEIQPEGLFYDYKAKYTDGLAKHIFPANIPQDIYDKTLEQALKLHKFLNCKSLSRCDFRYDEKHNSLKMLEINTHPGFTNLSLVPEIVLCKYGINFDQLVDFIVKDTLKIQNIDKEYLENYQIDQ